MTWKGKYERVLVWNRLLKCQLLKVKSQKKHIDGNFLKNYVIIITNANLLLQGCMAWMGLELWQDFPNIRKFYHHKSQWQGAIQGEISKTITKEAYSTWDQSLWLGCPKFHLQFNALVEIL